MDAALGMHGAGGYRAQCGLVEGALMFIGIWGKMHGKEEAEIVRIGILQTGSPKSSFRYLKGRKR